jgi:hypothetical protein
VLETDTDQFDCDTCPVREAQDRLRPENIEAWELFQVLMNRWVWDAQATGPYFLALTEDRPEDRRDLMERCALIYEILLPPPPQRQDA